MTVLQILLQIWQSIPIRVNWFLKNFSIDVPYQSSFRLFFFFFGGGEGGCKKCWVRQRTGKFGKIFLMIYRNLSCAVILIEFIYNSKIPALAQGLVIVLLKAQLVKKICKF